MRGFVPTPPETVDTMVQLLFADGRPPRTTPSLTQAAGRESSLTASFGGASGDGFRFRASLVSSQIRVTYQPCGRNMAGCVLYP